MVDAQPERIAGRRAAVPARHEAERRAAFLQAAVLERAELEQPGRREHRGADDPAVPARATAARVDSSAAVQRRARGARRRPTRQDSRRRRSATRRPAVGAPARDRGERCSRSGNVVGSIIAAIIRTQRERVEQRGHDDRRRRARAAEGGRRAGVGPATVLEIAAVGAARPGPQRRPGADERAAPQQRGEPTLRSATRRRRADARSDGRHRRARVRVAFMRRTRTCFAARCGP